MIKLVKYFIYCLLFTFHLVQADELKKDIKLDHLAPEPIFSPILNTNYMESSKICKIISLHLASHFETMNYDRIHLVVDYIKHHKNSIVNNPLLSALQTLETFTPQENSKKHQGASCAGLNQDMLFRLSAISHVYTIPATLFSHIQQQLWPRISHVAIAIPFQDPQKKEDFGYVLIDPHLRMRAPIVLSERSKSSQTSLLNIGKCTFYYNHNEIYCQKINPITGEFDSMTYYLKQFLNPVEALIKPILATDRAICLIARTKSGECLAKLEINLENKTIFYSLKGNCPFEIPFRDLQAYQSLFEELSSTIFQLPREDLYLSIKTIIENNDLLDSLYEQYKSLMKMDFNQQTFFAKTGSD